MNDPKPPLDPHGELYRIIVKILFHSPCGDHQSIRAIALVARQLTHAVELWLRTQRDPLA